MNEFDISTEVRRGYIYPDGSEFVIEQPNRLFVKKDENGDSHRVVTTPSDTFHGRTYYPRRGWIAIWWETYDSVENPVQF